MGNYSWTNLLDPFPSVGGAQFDTFTAAKDVSPVDLPSTKAGDLVKGTKVRLTANGEFSTTGTPTLGLGFHYGVAAGQAVSGGVSLALSSLITTASAAGGFPWWMEWLGTVIGVGASGSIRGSGKLYLGTSLTAFATPVPIPITKALRTVTIDTTAAKTFGVQATFSISNVANAVIVDNFEASILNLGKTA